MEAEGPGCSLGLIQDPMKLSWNILGSTAPDSLVFLEHGMDFNHRQSFLMFPHFFFHLGSNSSLKKPDFGHTNEFANGKEEFGRESESEVKKKLL